MFIHSSGINRQINCVNFLFGLGERRDSVGASRRRRRRDSVGIGATASACSTERRLGKGASKIVVSAMEIQAAQQVIGDDDQDEEFSDDFQCCVCLDIVYKPVVLACGHISCFWCVFQAMDSFGESHCPVCRNPYTHFPRICNLLHVLLLKLYPTAYQRKERQVAEEEKKYGHASPQLHVGDSSSLLGAVNVDSNATCGGDRSIIQDSLKITFPGEVNTTDIIPTSSSQHTITDKTNCIVGHCNRVSVGDLQCFVCMGLLCRPVVLNCGHVYCKGCIDHQHGNVYKCPVCQSAHPNGFPSVCLVIEHFLEEHFHEEYSARKEFLLTLKSAGPSGEKQDPAQSSHVPKNVHPLGFSDPNMFHYGAGCDYCGMYPIIGIRYRCKDCVEQIGFDLCEGCHKNSSKLSGRFNQQHTQEHQFVAIQPPNLRNLRLSLGAGHLEEYNGVVITNLTSTLEEVVPAVPHYAGGLANESEGTESLGSSVDDYSQDLEDALASPSELSVDHSL